MKKTDVLRSFAHLEPRIRARLRELLQEQTIPAKGQIFLQDAPSSAFYIIASGRVKAVRVTPEGHESIMCVRGSGEFLCPVTALDGGTQQATAIAMTEVKVLRAKRESFVALCQESPELLTIVQGACLSEVRHLIQRLETLASHDVKQRLAVALLDQTRRQQTYGGSQNELCLTQKELAALVGASRESVARILKRLEREGVLGLRRGRVIIHKVDIIRGLAGEENSGSSPQCKSAQPDRCP